MKKIFTIIKWAAISFFIALFLTTFLAQLKINTSLRRELASKKKELKEAKQASRKLEELERQSRQMEKEEEAISLNIPIFEQHPFSLIRDLTNLAAKSGTKDLLFDIKDSSSLEADQKTEIDQSLLPHYVVMSFEATFPQLKMFMKDLRALKRIVTVEKLTITRDENKLPYQKIALELISYSFAAK